MSILRTTLILAACLTMTTAAFAGSRRGDVRGTDVVVAQSKFGNGTVTGPVRMTSVGRQVQLPGGTWEHCKRSCSETLRVATVDFWEAQNGTTNECGIFGCLELRFPR